MKTKKQFLVIGLGRFGSSVAKNLSEIGCDVLAMDSSESLVDEISPFVTQAVQADATDEAALEAIGVRNFDVAVVSIGANVRDSILVCVLLKEQGVPYILAKATDELHGKVLTKIGVDRVVYPEREMGLRIAKSLVSTNVMELMELSNDAQIVEITLPAPWRDRTIGSLDIRNRYGVSVLAVHRAEEFIVSPGASTALLAGDTLLVLGTHESVNALSAVAP